MHVRRLLINVHHGRNDVLLPDSFLHEAAGAGVVGEDFFLRLPFEELKTGGNQRIHKPQAVLAGTALCCGDTLLDFGVILLQRLIIWKLSPVLLRSISGLLA